jgi:hypothetical protein
MKIDVYGTVTLRQGAGPLVEDWRVEREPDDPKDATTEQLLLAYAISWAEERFNQAKQQAQTEVVRKWIQAERVKQTKVN